MNVISVPLADSARTQRGWHAALSLAYIRRGEQSVLVRRSHVGPLVVQRSLYPEGDAVCHTVLLHPPAGIAGGDHLQVMVQVLKALGQYAVIHFRAEESMMEQYDYHRLDIQRQQHQHFL